MELIHLATIENIADGVQGSAIRVARESRGLDQVELSELTGIAIEKIPSIESNKFPISKEELEILSKQLNYPKSFFYHEFKPYKKFICRKWHSLFKP